jgi:hypothetical protein
MPKPRAAAGGNAADHGRGGSEGNTAFGPGGREPRDTVAMTVRSRPTQPAPEPREKEYQKLNPGAGGPPAQQQERHSRRNPQTTRDDGGAALPGGSNADIRGPRPRRGPRAGGV